MSRSNPNQNAPNPATRWMEWHGEKGTVRFYDKDLKENITVPLPFTFLLLDELASVRGWNEAGKSAIYSNEVRDTREEPFLVKSFKGETFAEGLYKDIKDAVCSKRVGGHFCANLYIAFKKSDGLAIGSLRFKGAALGAWMEFRKAHRGDLYSIAVTIGSFTEHTKGKIVYRVPVFKETTITPETNSKAIELDKQFQEWLTGYLARRTSDRAEPPIDEAEPDDNTPIPTDDDDIPF